MQTDKQLRIKIPIVEGKQEIFTHCLDGQFRHFPITTMNLVADEFGGRCPQIRATSVPVLKKQAEFIGINMGIEQKRLNRLKPPYLFKPILAVAWDTTTSPKITIVDGNHRYVKLAALNVSDIAVFIFQFGFWEQFLLGQRKDGVDPNTMLTGDSGMLELDRLKERAADRNPKATLAQRLKSCLHRFD